MIKNNYVENLLQNYNPVSDEEMIAKDQMLEFLNSNDNCFDRTCVEGHFTASSWLLNNDMNKVLLMHHTKLNKWLQLGGHCDGDSDVLNVAIKEAQEESGLNNIVAVNKDIFDIDVHFIPDNKKEAGHFHYDIRFLLKSGNNDTIQKNQESLDLKWFTKDVSSLPTTELSIIRMFNKWCNL